MSDKAPPDDLERVLDAELEYIRRNRHAGTATDIVSRSLVGLAMSGGGIRSATTNLGMLQALARMQILPMVDYVSTVSGGGYIGACMSALCSWNHNAAPSKDVRAAFTFAANERPAFSMNTKEFPFSPNFSHLDQDVLPREARLKEAAVREEESRAEKRGAESVLRARWDAMPPAKVHPRAANGIIAHLRTHGNFLIAHRGLFKREALRGLGALTIGGLYNALGFLLILITASALYLTGVLFLAPATPQTFSRSVAVIPPDTIRHTLVPTDSSITRTRSTLEPCNSKQDDCPGEIKTTLQPAGTWDRIKRNANAAMIIVGDSKSIRESAAFLPILFALLLGAIGGLIIVATIWETLDEYVRGRVTPPIPEAGESVEDQFERHVLQRSTWILAAVTLIALLFAKFLWRGEFKAEEEIVWLFMPVGTVSGAWIATFLLCTVVLPHFTSWTRRLRSLTSAFYSIASWGWWITLAFAISPIVVYALRGTPTKLGLSAIVSLIASRVLTGRSSGSKRFSLSPGALRIVLGIVVMLVLVLGEVFFAAVLTAYFDRWWQTALVTAAGAAIVTLFGWLANHNRLGPQYFYRDRLAETYLFSEAPDEDGKLRIFHDAMEMPLDSLHGDPNKRPEDNAEQSLEGAPERPLEDGPEKKAGWTNSAPYHLISAAINLAGSRDLTRKDRKSGYWLFSKLYCGSIHTGFRRTRLYRGGATKLADAIAISGAAASSGIGKDTFFAQAFATVLFNIRLGSWLENPAYASSILEKDRWVFWPAYLMREALMNTTESAPRVNLSDGGHTGDNIGLYPLLQRRCKVIVVCDA
ncbi:MAG TPA: hypothetical protein VKO87_06585, partial [Gemmatimonadaceae bacterium]|nr:hypothetical protein [Gemmatimonadaceae bacterium]